MTMSQQGGSGMHAPGKATMLDGTSPGVGAMTERDNPAYTATHGGSLEGTSVLLVEDAWHIAVAMQSLLENAGVVVIGPAASIARAEALLETSRPDAAIVDINVKGRMSYDLIERLSAAGTPVIVVSGYDELERLRGKVAATLSKPVRAGILLGELRKAILTKRAS